MCRTVRLGADLKSWDRRIVRGSIPRVWCVNVRRLDGESEVSLDEGQGPRRLYVSWSFVF